MGGHIKTLPNLEASYFEVNLTSDITNRDAVTTSYAYINRIFFKELLGDQIIIK